MLATNTLSFKNLNYSFVLLVFLALLSSALIDQSLTSQIEKAIRSPNGLSQSIWLWGGLSILNGLLMPLVSSMFTCRAWVPQLGSTKDFFKGKFELGLLETMRVWGYTTLWCFLFILPGIYKYTVYMLSPLVVFFSQKYAKGEVDALDYSTKITKKFYGWFNFYLLIFLFLYPVLSSTLLDEFKLFSLHPFWAIFSVIFDTFALVIFHYFVLKHFLKHLQEVENGSDVQLEKN